MRQDDLPSTRVIGKKLGHYVVRERLGRGGMGEVFAAEDTKLGRQVALKLLPPRLAADADRRRRFELEARAVAALNHPNIVTIHAVEESEGLVFLVMERVEGASLRDVLEGGALPLGDVLRTGAQIAEALAAAHDAHLVHRDLKPDNVMLTRDGRVKLVDFGLAKHLAPPAADSQAGTMVRETRPGMTVGTAGYMAPEQALGRELDLRADLFALGVVLYEMATGASPFQGETLAAYFDSLLHEAPPSARRANPELPEDFERVLDRALQKEPAHRYQTARELLNDLQRVGTGKVEATPTASAPARSTVAVLPFHDLSPERDQEYFCHGLAEELINCLASAGGMQVVARSSAFSLHGQGLDVREIARRLHAGAVLEGSVRKAGDRLRITVQLVDARNGYQIWSKRFDRELDDVFAVQDEIAGAVVSELESGLGLSKHRSDRRRASNLEAYDAYLQGLHAMNRWTEEWVDRAIACFQEAIEKDPGYALPRAALAECLVWFYSGIGTRPARLTIPEARRAAEKALELGPELSEAHKAMGLIAMNHDWDRGGTETAFRRALELNPGSADLRVWNAWRLALLEGSYDRALRELRRAEDLDPLDLKLKVQIGYVYYFLRDFERAHAQFRSVVALDSHFAYAHYAVGDVLIQQGEYERAVAAVEESVRLGGRSVNHVGVLAYAKGRAGKAAEATELLGEVQERVQREEGSPLWVALAHLGLGELDEVFAWLGRALEERDGSLVLIAATPEFDPVRADPRFLEILDRMGLSRRDPPAPARPGTT